MDCGRENRAFDGRFVPIWSIVPVTLTPLMRATRAVIPVDGGWLFIAAGLVMLFACLLIPPQKQTYEISQQLSLFRAEEQLAMQRLRAYTDFLMALDAGDVNLTRRLAAAQLNLARADETPVLLASSASSPVTRWIEESIASQPVVQRSFPESRLSTMVTGTRGHWLMAGAAGCLFIGLITGPRNPKRQGEVREQEQDS